MSTLATATGRILVVDDQPANLRAVSVLLSRRGYEVVTAGNGEEALALVDAQTPDLVLLDMMMPGMDGFELLAELRTRGELQQLPAIFVTAAHDRDLLLRAFDAGAVDYVTKPFIPEELMARVSAHVGLKLARDRLARVAHERQQLVNLVAHDLKNPLSSVLFASDMLRNDACKRERIPRYLEIIHDSCSDALNYIRRYLELQGRMANDKDSGGHCDSHTPLHDLVQWLEGRYALQLESRGQSLQLADVPADARVVIEAVVLRQVAENLISNAMKYAPDSGIDVSVRQGAPGYWQVLVEDRGPGIPEKLQNELFKPFVRLSQDDPTKGYSSGLGLSLARQIIFDCDGQLWYEDREGGGARFVMELPAANGKRDAD